MTIRARVIPSLAHSLLIGFACASVYHFYLRIAVEATGPLNYDAPVWMAVGRGIVNGLKPYVDLFEIKPPVIFYIFAGNWLLSDRLTPTITLQILSLVLLAGFPILAAAPLAQARPQTRSPLIIVAGLGGAVLSLFLATFTSGILVETFGCVFLLPWIWIWVHGSHRDSYLPSLCAATASLALSAGTKEPFALVAVAVALLNLRSFRKDVRFLAASVLGAIALGHVLLFTVGLLRGYYGYLAFLFGDFLAQSAVPIWERTLDWGPVWQYASAFSGGLPFLLLSWIALFVTDAVAGQRPTTALTRCACLALAWLLTSLAANSGGMRLPHHVCFFVPLWVTLWLLALQCFACGPFPTSRWRDVLHAGAVGLLLWTLADMTPAREPDLNQRSDLADSQRAAQAIDQVLSCLGEARYAFVGRNYLQPYAWTKHSPAGPFFSQLWFFFEHNPGRRSEFIAQLKRHKVLVVSRDYQGAPTLDGETSALVDRLIEEHYRDQLPVACRGPALPGQWRLFYASRAAGS